MAAMRRSRSLDWSTVFSQLTEKLTRHAASFTQLFNDSEPEMRQIVAEFQEIAADVKEMQETMDRQRRKGVVTGGVGLVLILAAPFTGGTSLLAAGGLAAAAGGGYVVKTNVSKAKEENRHVKEVEELGNKFMEVVELLKNDLEEIKLTCEELQRPSMKLQAVYTLANVETFHWTLAFVSELAEMSGQVLSVTETVMKMMRDVVMLIVSVFRVTATPEEDQRLRESIIQSADQCQKVVNDFDQLTEKLRSTENLRYKTRSRSVTV